MLLARNTDVLQRAASDAQEQIGVTLPGRRRLVRRRRDVSRRGRRSGLGGLRGRLCGGPAGGGSCGDVTRHGGGATAADCEAGSAAAGGAVTLPGWKAALVRRRV
jgi:hypothetical protein